MDLTSANPAEVRTEPPEPPADLQEAAETKGLSSANVSLLAIACGISVANVYYAQPLLDAIASDFGISHAAAGGVITATQGGCALALLLVVPLGDLVNRKRLITAQSVLLLAALMGVVVAPNAGWLLAGMASLGLLGTAMTQGLIAYAATLAPPKARGRVVGATQSGVVIGLLTARALAGVLTDLAGWRAVYLASGAMVMLVSLILCRALPTVDAAPSPLRYAQLLRSMATLVMTERVLQVRGGIGLLMFAAFSIFWSALVLPLSQPPWALSHAGVGAFGLVGVVGALAAARAGHWVDRGWAQRTTGIGLACLLAAWLPISFLTTSLWALAVGIVLLDLGGQAVHVVNQSLIFRIRPEAHSRLVGCYMLFYAAGSGLGAILSTWVYALAGWQGVCLTGASVSALAGVFWIATKPSGPSSDIH